MSPMAPAEDTVAALPLLFARTMAWHRTSDTPIRRVASTTAAVTAKVRVGLAPAIRKMLVKRSQQAAGQTGNRMRRAAMRRKFSCHGAHTGISRPTIQSTKSGPKYWPSGESRLSKFSGPFPAWHALARTHCRSLYPRCAPICAPLPSKALRCNRMPSLYRRTSL